MTPPSVQGQHNLQQKENNMKTMSHYLHFRDPSRRGLSATRGDERLMGKDKIVGVHEGSDAAAVPQSVLEKKCVVEFLLAGKPGAVWTARSPGTRAASARVLREGDFTSGRARLAGQAWSHISGPCPPGEILEGR